MDGFRTPFTLLNIGKQNSKTQNSKKKIKNPFKNFQPKKPLQKTPQTQKSPITPTQKITPNHSNLA